MLNVFENLIRGGQFLG